jgi:hypothetical protein
MAATLESLRARLRVALMNAAATAQPWDDAVLDEGIRLALGEYGLAGAAPVTLSGLDGAAETSLNGLHESLVVWGAGGYAALSRAVLRAESFQLGGEAEALRSWGEARLEDFKAMLGAVFPGYRPGPALPGDDRAAEAARLADLRGSTAPPWGSWPPDPLRG